METSQKMNLETTQLVWKYGVQKNSEAISLNTTATHGLNSYEFCTKKGCQNSAAVIRIGS
jgi:hypothetical protein